MTRLFLITLLVLSSGAVYAEWVKIGGNDENGLTTYADPDTIRRKGDLVKMWTLYDYKIPQTEAGVSYLSLRMQDEYDCTDERTRSLAVTSYSGNMESGKPIYNNSDAGKWAPIAPRTLYQTLWKFACGKK